jgi:hypothetical protein
LIGVTQIWERLFLGSLYDAERLGRANPLGIGTVVSLSQTAPCNTRREINYIHLPVEDAQAIPVRQFDAIIGAIAENIRRGKLLVHCGSGISRAPVMPEMHLMVVVFPDPLGPSSPKHSPGATSNEMSVTASTSRPERWW